MGRSLQKRSSGHYVLELWRKVMAVIGLITQDGLDKCIEAQADKGYFILPKSAAVSSVAGPWDQNRTAAQNPSTWFSAILSNQRQVGKGAIEVTLTIPPGATNTAQYVREIQIFAEDTESNSFFPGFGQPGDPPTTVTPILYEPSDILEIRMQIVISPLAVGNVFQFIYSQAEEIAQHDAADNAHPKLLALLEKHGIFMFESQMTDSGQWVDIYPDFQEDVSVYVDGTVVYPLNGKYQKAIDPPSGAPLGVVKNEGGTRVIFGGFCSSPGLNVATGTPLYLNPTNATVTDAVYLNKLAVSMGQNRYIIMGAASALSGGNGDVVGYGTNITSDLELTMETITSGMFDSANGGYIASVVGPIKATFTLNDENELIANIQ